MVSDRTLGAAVLFATLSIFVYYTCWAVFLPLFDTDSPVHGWFPPIEWAVRIPAFLLVLGMSAIGLFIGSQIVRAHSQTGKVKST